MVENCFFCDIRDKDCLLETDNFYSRGDDFRVNKGHTLVFSKKHVESFFNLKSEEITELYELIRDIREVLKENFHPDGYNIGGIRNIISSKGDYSKEVKTKFSGRVKYIK